MNAAVMPGFSFSFFASAFLLFQVQPLLRDTYADALRAAALALGTALAALLVACGAWNESPSSARADVAAATGTPKAMAVPASRPR